EATVPTEGQIPDPVEREILSLVGVVQLIDRQFRCVPVIQAVILFIGFRKGVGQSEEQDAGVPTADHSLLDLELESVGSVVPGLNQIVGDVAENRVWPEQVLGADR